MAATQQAPAERHYGFSDGTLEQLANLIADNVTRDLTEFGPRGIDSGTVTALLDKRTAFLNVPTDDEAVADITIAVEAKEEAVKTVLIKARALRTAAQDVFGQNTGKYNRFGFQDMDRLDDKELPLALRKMHRAGVKYQTDLAGEGIDTTFLDAFEDLIDALDAALKNVSIAEEDRDDLKLERIDKGNALYKECVRLCNIGKDIFAPVNESKYNDYVIEHFVGPDESITHDYNIHTAVVPANGSLLAEVGPGALTLLDVYARAVNGSVIVCTTDLPANPCTSGFDLMEKVTFHGPITGMGLDLTKTNLQFTNPSLSDVTLRFGLKKEV